MTVLIVQRYTDDRLRGRAFTLIISAHNLLLGIAMVAAGALTELPARAGRTSSPRRSSGGGFAALVLSRGITAEADVARQQAA